LRASIRRTSAWITAKSRLEPPAFCGSAAEDQVESPCAAYPQAITEAFKANEVRVREQSGLALSGKDLMAKAFDADVGPIQISHELGQSWKDEQEGFRFLFMGAMVGIRQFGLIEIATIGLMTSKGRHPRRGGIPVDLVRRCLACRRSNPGLQDTHGENYRRRHCTRPWWLTAHYRHALG
jgi:Protein of unknown function (Hypoth_ymh)